jgi:phosphatidylglycerol---prolipoprotein diacylglyceryl transferase
LFPVLFEVGGFTVTSFGLMMFMSFITGSWILSLQLKRRGMNPDIAWEVLAWVALAGVLGAKLYYMGLHWQDVVENPMREILSRGGLVWYGGFIGGVSAYYWQVRKRGLPMATMFDAVAPALALAYAVGRVGCFLVGDDYGLPTDAWYGVAFPEGMPPSTAGNLRTYFNADIPASIPDWQVLAVHPTQLYEVAAALVMFAILWKLSGRQLFTGQLFAVYLALYGFERFLVEFVRAKGDRYLFGLSTAQFASLFLVAAGFYLWQRRRRVAQVAPVTPKQEPGAGRRTPARK